MKLGQNLCSTQVDLKAYMLNLLLWGYWVWMIFVHICVSLLWAQCISPRFSGPAKRGSEVICDFYIEEIRMKSSIETLLFLTASFWLQTHLNLLENPFSNHFLHWVLSQIGSEGCLPSVRYHAGSSYTEPWSTGLWWVGVGVVQHPIAQKAWNKLSQGQWAMNRRAMNAEPLPHLNFHYWGLREWRQLKFQSRQALSALFRNLRRISLLQVVRMDLVFQGCSCHCD